MHVIFYEDQFVNEGEVKIPLSDRGFQFGDGAFAVIQVRDGVPFFLEEHLEQLKKQCETFNLKSPTINTEIIEELIKRNNASLGIWRMKIIVTGGDGFEAHLPKRNGRVIIFVKPFSPHPFKPLKMEIFPIPYYSCHAFFKSLSHLNRFYVMEEARKRGVDDCVTVTEKGALLEASFGNLFWVKEKVVITPDPALPLYFGITIKNIIKFAQSIGFETQFVRCSPQELPHDATAFRTNTMQGVRPIAQIGSRCFQQNPTVEALFINGYEDLLKKQAFSCSAVQPLSGQQFF